MAELRLSMTQEARTVLSDLLRLIAPAAARVSVNRANVPNNDEEIAGFWVDTLSAQASEEARLLAVAFAPGRVPVLAACLLTPWIDERFVLGLPLALLVAATAARAIDEYVI